MPNDVIRTVGYAQVVTAPIELPCPAVASGAYVAGDRLGPATGTALLEIPGMAITAGRGGEIRMCSVSINKKSLVARLRLHFYNRYSSSAPSELVADNAQWKQLYADRTYRIGYLDLIALTTAADVANSDMSRTQEVYAGQFPLPYTCLATSLWVGVETLDGIAALDNGTNIAITLKALLN